MTDGRGLSIFDDVPGEPGPAEQPTQVIPVVDAEAAPSTPARPPAPQQPAPTQPPAAPAQYAAPGTLTSVNFPISRRGGYDKDAVDRSFADMSTEKATLSTSLGEARRRVAELEGNAVLATGAYNAGIGAVKRWLAGPLPPWDLWVETVPYKETREYIARVLAFAVLYDWRIDGSPARLSGLIPGLAERPEPAPVACPGGTVAAATQPAASAR